MAILRGVGYPTGFLIVAPEPSSTALLLACAGFYAGLRRWRRDSLIVNLWSFIHAPVFIFIVPRGGGGVLAMLFLMPVMLIGAIAGPLFVGYMVYTSLTTEWNYHARYGDTWKEHFREEQRMSVEETNQRMMVGVGGLIVIGGTVYLIYRQIAPKRPGSSRSRRRSRGRC